MFVYLTLLVEDYTAFLYSDSSSSHDSCFQIDSTFTMLTSSWIQSHQYLMIGIIFELKYIYLLQDCHQMCF
jgi:hypothetical protein